MFLLFLPPFSLIIIIIRTIYVYIKEYIISIPVTQVETTVLFYRGTTGDSVGLTVHTIHIHTRNTHGLTREDMCV